MKTINKIAILSISFLTLIATIAIAPALTAISDHFNNAPALLVQLVVTLPALICIPIGLLSNLLIKVISKKNLVIIGVILYLVGGLLSMISPSIYFLLLTRAILGLGLGIIAPLCFVIIGDFFTGKERANLMGFSSATTNLGGILSTLVVGFLSSRGWRFSFLIYLVCIIVLFLVVFFLPNDKSKSKVIDIDDKNLKELEKDIKLNKSVLKYVIIILLALIAFYALPTGIDFLFEEKHLGGAKIASDIVSVATLASLISSATFGKTMKIFKEKISIILLALMAIGFLLIGFSSSIIVIGLGALFIGVGFGGIIPYTIFYGSNVVHDKHSALAITLISTGLYLGEFISPIILNVISKALKFESISGSFYSAALVCAISIVFAIYTNISLKKRGDIK